MAMTQAGATPAKRSMAAIQGSASTLICGSFSAKGLLASNSWARISSMRFATWREPRSASKSQAWDGAALQRPPRSAISAALKSRIAALSA